MKIVFFGSQEFIIPVLKNLEEHFEVVAVVTTKDSPTSKYFKGLKLTPDKLDEEIVIQLQRLEPDLFVVSSYGKIIPQSILDLPKYGNLNVHPSLLPKYRGASPLQGVILNGEEKTGVTIMLMDEKMDHGPILKSREFILLQQDTFETLGNKLFQEGAALLIDTINQFIEGKLTPKPQDHSKATFTKLIKKEDGYFDINTPPSPEILDRMIRAYYPWPTTWTTWKDKIVKFLPGGLIQMEGKKPIPFKDFLNGYPDFPLKNMDL